MKYTYLLIVVLFMLACGAPMVLDAPTVTPDVQTPSYDVNTPVHIYTRTPSKIVIRDGTWNIREGAGLSYPVIGYAHAGDEFTPLGAVHGWVQTSEGYICNRAFGTNEECE